VIWVLNGPNLNTLGTREPEIYGSATYADLVALCERTATEVGEQVEVRQTNHEGELIGWLQQAAREGHAVVLNGAGWTHTSIALADACALLTAPLVEVHISNIHKREPYRHHSYVSAVAAGVIVGLGVPGYALAIRWLADRRA
jgi:3-dehydroquinate dehydratase II